MSAKKVLLYTSYAVLGTTVAMRFHEVAPTRHLDWTDFICWAVCAVLIYVSLSFRTYIAVRNAKERMRKVKK